MDEVFKPIAQALLVFGGFIGFWVACLAVEKAILND